MPNVQIDNGCSRVQLAWDSDYSILELQVTVTSAGFYGHTQADALPEALAAFASDVAALDDSRKGVARFEAVGDNPF